MTAHLRLITPNNENRSVPVRPPNSELRTREYLTPKEVEKLIKAAKDGRWGHRDATLVLVAFRHGLRASEICDLEWSQVEFGRSPSLHVRRVRMASRAFTRSAATRCALSGRFMPKPKATLSLRLSAAGRSRRTLSTGS